MHHHEDVLQRIVEARLRHAGAPEGPVHEVERLCVHHIEHGRRRSEEMREVAVTEGDKVAAEITFGYAVNGYGVGDLVKHVAEASDAAVVAAILDFALGGLAGEATTR